MSRDRSLTTKVVNAISTQGPGALEGWELLKVAHITPTYFGEASVVGGGERYALELSRSLARKISTTLITFSKGGQPTIETDESLEIRRYPVSRFVGGNLANPFTLAFVKHLRPYDCLHCYGYPTAVTDLCILYAKVFRKKIFVTDVHGGGRSASTYMAKLGVDTRRFLDGILSFSEYSAQRHKARAERVRVIGGGVDTDHFYPLNVARDRSVLFVGRLIPIKGIDYLIDAVDLNTSLRIVGRPYDERYLQDLRAKAQGKTVEFVTHATERNLIREYSSALVTVTPSVYTDMYGRATEGEGLCLVALESMACGTPVIATRCGGLVEVVEDGVTGFLVPPNDSGALKGKIQYFLDHPEIARSMGQAARERVLRDFTWDRVATNCIRAYREAIES
jgi:glycosyltransferase involved in cell wall biosynthesis